MTRTTMVRTALSVAAVVAIFVGCEATPSQAQTYGDGEWCAVIAPTDGSIRWNCWYRTAAECAPNVIAGDRGFCNVNPYWSSARAAPTDAPKTHRKRVAQR